MKRYDMYNKKEYVLNILGLIICIAFLFPLYWIVVSSFKNEAEIFMVPPTFFPKKISLNAYIVQVFGEYNILKNFFNSIFISTSTMIVSMLLAVPAAYGMARFSFKGKKIIIQTFLVTQMLPATLILTPLFICLNKIGFINTYLAPIIGDCILGIPFAVLILRAFFLTLPKSLEDSARIDGCNRLTSFVRIMVPISLPGILVAGVFCFLFAWGDLIYSLTFLNKQSMRPMTAAIYNFISQYGIAWNRVMAFGTLIVLPVVVIFIALQKHIITGLTVGAVKG